jgi:hypothetical protein
MKIFEIKKSDRVKYQNEIEALEEIAEYPLGDDFFKISHGKDYFNFFDRLGESHYFVCIIGNKVVAVACGIIRKMDFKPIFYLCDLKVHPDFRGRHIPLRILLRAAFRYYLKCPRGYAISMDHKGQKENRVAKLLKKFWILPFKVSAKILIYSLDYQQITNIRNLLEDHKGKIGFLSLKGTKDLILKSTQAPIPLLHIQYGVTGDFSENLPREGYSHMISLLAIDQLVKLLENKNIFPDNTATLISHNTKSFNWDFVLTSDI